MAEPHRILLSGNSQLVADFLVLVLLDISQAAPDKIEKDRVRKQLKYNGFIDDAASFIPSEKYELVKLISGTSR